MNQSERTGPHPDNERLGAWHDGELDRTEAAAVREHVESCPLCRSAVDEMARIDETAGVVRDDIPGEAFWAGLEARIMNEIGSAEEEAGAGVHTGVVEPARRERNPGRRGRSWWSVLFGRGGAPALPWAMATAAGLVVVVLSSRLILNQLSPAGTVLDSAPMRDRAETPAAPGLPAETRAREVPEAPRRVAPEAGTAGSEGQMSGATANDPTMIRDHAVESGPEELQDAASGRVQPPEASATQTRPPAPESFPAPPPVPSSDPDDRTAYLMKSDDAMAKKESSAPAAGTSLQSPGAAPDPAMASLKANPNRVEDAASNEALGYAAEVERTLRVRKEVDGGERFASPPAGASRQDEGGQATDVIEAQTLEEKVSDAARRRKALARPRGADYEIAYAAAFRALEAGNLDLARRGFRLVADGIPESPLARDADFNEKLVQFRVLQRQGIDPEMVLLQASERAEQAWDRAQERKTAATCREALALERVRSVLLREVRPGADLAPYEDRMARLRACS